MILTKLLALYEVFKKFLETAISCKITELYCYMNYTEIRRKF